MQDFSEVVRDSRDAEALRSATRRWLYLQDPSLAYRLANSVNSSTVAQFHYRVTVPSLRSGLEPGLAEKLCGQNPL
jgi:hypothetical protein